MDYLDIKAVHQAAVALSFCGFVARGAGALAGAAWVRGRIARSLPHVIDTVLLLSAVALVWLLRMNPINAPWLMAKIAGLVAYIGLGMVALRPGTPRGVRVVAWLAALAVFGYIVSVAITKSPAGFLRAL